MRRAGGPVYWDHRVAPQEERRVKNRSFPEGAALPCASSAFRESRASGRSPAAAIRSENHESAMYFDTTPLNITTMLVVALAVVALVLLLRGRYDSNVPLLFYAVTVGLISVTDRSLNTYLLYSGLAFALVLRFEFMGKGFTRFIGFLNTFSIGLIAVAFLDQIFGDGKALF
jgi:hypothetical protein